MKLYHGSTTDIGRIDLAKSKPNKDFGRAFYLSADRQQSIGGRWPDRLTARTCRCRRDCGRRCGRAGARCATTGGRCG